MKHSTSLMIRPHPSGWKMSHRTSEIWILWGISPVSELISTRSHAMKRDVEYWFEASCPTPSYLFFHLSFLFTSEDRRMELRFRLSYELKCVARSEKRVQQRKLIDRRKTEAIEKKLLMKNFYTSVFKAIKHHGQPMHTRKALNSEPREHKSSPRIVEPDTLRFEWYWTTRIKYSMIEKTRQATSYKTGPVLCEFGKDQCRGSDPLIPENYHLPLSKYPMKAKERLDFPICTSHLLPVYQLHHKWIGSFNRLFLLR